MPQEIKPRRPSSRAKAATNAATPQEAKRRPARKAASAKGVAGTAEAGVIAPVAPTKATTGKAAAKGATRPSSRTGKSAGVPARSAKSGVAKTAAREAPKARGRKAATPSPAADEAAPKARRRAVANAAAAVHGRTVSAWTKKEIVEAFTRFEAQEPEPQGELEHSDPFTLLVAVVLSAQATDTGVNKATRGLFAAAATPAAMAALGEEKVAHFIRTLGLYKGKAKNVVELSRLLLARHKGEVPRDREALEALPGVGRKTANVVLNIAFGMPTIAVDTHLFRVANRTGLAPGATPLAVELGLEERIPDRFKLHAHHWLILHGRYICKAAKPACSRCIIADLCRWPDKTP